MVGPLLFALREMSSLIIYRNRELQLPDTILKFPVSISREFLEKAQPMCGDFLAQMPGSRRKWKNSLYFPCLTGNLAAETGSIETASSASQSAISEFSAENSKIDRMSANFVQT